MMGKNNAGKNISVDDICTGAMFAIVSIPLMLFLLSTFFPQYLSGMDFYSVIPYLLPFALFIGCLTTWGVYHERILKKKK